MSAFFLYHRSTSPTGRLLAKALGVRYGHLGPGQTPRRERSIQSSLIHATSLIRWGSQQATDTLCRPTSTLNTVEALSLASNKLRTMRALEDAGVPTPTWTTSSSTAATYEFRSNAGGSVVLGRSLHGAKGRDIRVFLEGEEPYGCDFYTAYVPNTREYRVHVFQGEVIRVQGKYLDFPDEHVNPYIKNYAQGFRFRAPDKQPNQERLDTAVKAVEVLGLDFGAVDLLRGEDGKTYILEVNTAPACSPLTAKAYVQKFAEWLGVEPDYSLLEQRNAPVRERVLVST